jgi:RNA 2',3'-cyclic 3'-phosphodiesterase
LRVFLAADLDAGVRGKIAELARELPSLTRRARWVRPEGLHLTLRFFGEVPVEEVATLAEALKEALSGLAAFPLELRGCGVFPERGRPRVLFVPVAHPPKALFDLQTRAEECARALGFAPETRRFEPHLTVARFREREKEVGSILDAFGSRSFGVSPVGEAILFESRLSGEGARYEKLRAFPLASSPQES